MLMAFKIWKILYISLYFYKDKRLILVLIQHLKLLHEHSG